MEEQNFVGPQRTWKCESGQHEIIIKPDSILAISWALSQEQGKIGPLIVPDISCHLCHQRSHNTKATNTDPV